MVDARWLMVKEKERRQSKPGEYLYFMYINLTIVHKNGKGSSSLEQSRTQNTEQERRYEKERREID